MAHVEDEEAAVLADGQSFGLNSYGLSSYGARRG